MKQYILFLSAALLVSGCTQKTEEQPTREALSVVTEMVGSVPASQGTSYVGRVEASSETLVSFTGTGMVTRVCVSEGQHISQGQLVAEMDATQQRNLLGIAEAQMVQANDALRRMQQLHDAGSLPDIKWVEVQQQVAQAQQQVAAAKKAIADCQVVAPCSGIVGKKMMNAGETALPAQPICTIMNTGTVKVVASVPEREVARLTSGTSSEIFVGALGRSFTGGSLEKGVSGDATTHTYDVRISVSNPGGELLPGMVCNVTLGGGQTTADMAGAALTVPLRTVQQAANGQQFVWVVRGQKAHRQNVTLGQTVGNRLIITSGLTSGDEVITEGYQKVSEGSKVKVSPNN